MRSILSATALSALIAFAVPALAQTGAGTGASGTGSAPSGISGGGQTQGQTPGSPLPMTQPGPGTMSSSQRPGTAAGAMGSTSGGHMGSGQMGGSQMGSSGMGSSGMGSSGMGSSGMGSSGMGSSGTQAMTMDETQVRDLLRTQGYGEVQSVTRDGDNFRARVTRNGRPTDVNIDAYTGTIRNQAARR